MDATDQGPATSTGSLWRWGALIVVAAVALAYLAVVTAPRRAPDGATGPAIGRTLPNFRLQPLTGDGEPVTQADLAGRVSVVNFWGTWCPPCILEFPHIVDLAARFKSHPDFRLYAVSCGGDRNEDVESLRSQTQEFLEAARVKLPTWWDENFVSRQALMFVAGLDMAYPTTIVVDRHGKIRGLWQGYVSGTELEMEHVVEELLKSGEG